MWDRTIFYLKHKYQQLWLLKHTLINFDLLKFWKIDFKNQKMKSFGHFFIKEKLIIKEN